MVAVIVEVVMVVVVVHTHELLVAVVEVVHSRFTSSIRDSSVRPYVKRVC